MQKQVELILIGAGNRGRGIFGAYALSSPHRAKFVAVVEPDEARREAFGQDHEIEPARRFRTIEELWAVGKRLADGVVIATMETERWDIVKGAIDRGYHILLEKPLACTPNETVRIIDAARGFSGIFIVCHQMRYVPGYSTLKGLMDSGAYGQIIAIQHSENLSYHHMAHSFVRGLWNNDRITPMILAKSCHDMDFLCYLAAARPLRIASFGSLTHFRKEKAPAGAPRFCLEGCPAYRECPYDVSKLYFNDDTDPAYIRQMGIVQDRQELRELLKHNQFGRCVYHCDNNVVDHQVVQVEFSGGITASFQMAGHNYHERRITKLSMTNGEIYYDASEGVVKAYRFEPLREETIRPAGMVGSHLGGDKVIMDSFVDAIATGDKQNLLTPVEMSLDSHLMAFAAEASRRSGRVIDLREFEENCRKTPA